MNSYFKNIMDIRIALECLAVELATPKIPQAEIQHALRRYQIGGEHLSQTGDVSLLVESDNLVQDLILNYCDNLQLINIVNQQKDLIDWGHRIVATYLPNAHETALPEHLQILNNLLRRDVAATQHSLRRHLQITFERTIIAWD